jgi:diaminopimelate epimerase
MITFVKYHGTGNDFILIDDRKTMHQLSAEQIKSLCDRHFGIGADGLIQIRNKKDYDFEMLYYNSDGQVGSMCGNGGRCAVAFSHSLGLIKENATFLAFDGNHRAKVVSQNPYIVKLEMKDVTKIEKTGEAIVMNTGSPHYTTFVEDLKELDVFNEGRKIRYSARYKIDGTNVNFVEQKNGLLFVRTYERGVEDETLSCGTGVTASVLSAAFLNKIDSNKYNVITPGGDLVVYYNKDQNGFSDIWLEGKAQAVFYGEIIQDN